MALLRSFTQLKPSLSKYNFSYDVSTIYQNRVIDKINNNIGLNLGDYKLPFISINNIEEVNKLVDTISKEYPNINWLKNKKQCNIEELKLIDKFNKDANMKLTYDNLHNEINNSCNKSIKNYETYVKDPQLYHILPPLNVSLTINYPLTNPILRHLIGFVVYYYIKIGIIPQPIISNIEYKLHSIYKSKCSFKKGIALRNFLAFKWNKILPLIYDIDNQYDYTFRYVVKFNESYNMNVFKSAQETFPKELLPQLEKIMKNLHNQKIHSRTVIFDAFSPATTRAVDGTTIKLHSLDWNMLDKETLGNRVY